jgi:dephospho-CoA kinase
VGRLLEARGFPVLDVDRLGHEAIEAEKAVIVQRFGEDILTQGGLVDRKLLGARVFGRPEELAALEAIVHPAANRMTKEWIAARAVEAASRPCVINAALLHRSSAFMELAAIILVDAPLLTRLLRARRRDGLSWAALVRRFGSQKNFSAQYFQRKTDIYRVENRGYFGFAARWHQQKLKNRIDRIITEITGD